jgi:hypothetical protein
MPMSQPKRVRATAWLVIEPVYRYSGATDDKGRRVLDGAKIVSMTQGQPTNKRVTSGTVITKITLDLNAEALLPLQPEVVINIEPGDVGVIEVYADAPEEEDQ